jgi:predicted nucleic acid-binding protein
MIFLDTNICIALRDLDEATWRQVRALDDGPVMSMITGIELENGAHAEVGLERPRRALLDELLTVVPVTLFTHDDILSYRSIVYNLGFSRPRTLDRLIAAQAITRDARLVTRDGKDFREIERLRLIDW